MKNVFLLLTVSFILICSCKKDVNYGCTDPLADNWDVLADEDNGTCTYITEGSVMFWMSSDKGVISIYIDNKYEGQVTHFYSTYDPECNADGCLTIDLEEGTYDLRAESVKGSKWQSEITIVKGMCKKLLLN